MTVAVNVKLLIRGDPELFKTITRTRVINYVGIESHKTTSISKSAFVIAPKCNNNLRTKIRLLLGRFF